MASLITTLADLVCPKFDNSFIAWLNTLKNNQIELCEAIDNFDPASVTMLDTPVRILNVAQARADGTFDSGNTTVNLNSLAGVTVPTGAKAAIVRCSSGNSGQDTRGGPISSLFVHCHIEIARTAALLNGGNFFSGQAVPTQVTYTDSNELDGDNDNCNDAMVGLNGTSFAYRAKCRFNDTFGIDTGIARISLVGFIT